MHTLITKWVPSIATSGIKQYAQLCASVLCVLPMPSLLPFVGGVLFHTVCMLANSTSAATQYTLLKGKGVEVCEAYAKNLESFHDLAPMLCERKINPILKDFRKPVWQELDIWANRELLKQIDHFLNGAQAYSVSHPQAWEEFIKEAIERRHLVITLAHIDIDNDGKAENVIKYYDGSCPITRTYATPVLVLNKSKNGLDIKKTMHIMQNPSMKISGVVYNPTQTWGGTMYDIFLYKSRTYFDSFRIDREVINGLFRVFETEKKHTKEICTYRYSSAQ